MKTAFLFSGQGAQYQGMGQDLYQETIVKETFDEASDILGYDMAKLCFSKNEQLNQTKYTQPAILTVSIAFYRLLSEHGIMPQAALGLSLGEYSALVSSEALTFGEAVALVAKRGTYMTEATPAGSGKMVAIMNTPVEIIEESCLKAQQFGIVSPANYNTPQQIVIGGEEQAVDEAVKLLEEKGIKRIMPLNVSGPFHTEILAPAAKKLGLELKGLSFKEPKIPVISNTTTEVMKKDRIPILLEQQVMKPVHFYESIQQLKDLGIERVIEVGPGKVLSGFMKKIDKSIPVLRVENKKTLDETITSIGGMLWS
ncbi:MAG: ACP S-malonyltransferase [Enterococcus lacertideformus]|uniref:Malonyl CoA-acyl carrier protein transacylase n=1 Tax=Enterococcus lacertideformus TaxID=2771493 RepID=A0A931ATX2_9ENTE|nr:ACP S-malonyltransferase [Enterococcus lacertideformus]